MILDIDAIAYSIVTRHLRQTRWTANKDEDEDDDDDEDDDVDEDKNEDKISKAQILLVE
jgi:hypothetical protein